MAVTPIPEPDGASPTKGAFNWRAFLERVRVPIFLLNRRAQLVHVNRAWEELTGLAADRVRGSLRRRRRERARSFAALQPVLQALEPPAETLEGQTARRRRLSPRGQASHGWWDILFVPLGAGSEFSGVLGTIRLIPFSAQAAPLPLSEALVNLRLQRQHDYRLDNLDSEVPAMRRVVEQVRLASHTRVPVLLLGEAGTGKEWVARTIHQQSELREAPLVALDCARLPASAVAAVLVGDGRTGPALARGVVYLREPACLTHDLQEQLAQQVGAGAWQGSSPTWLLAGMSTDPLEALRAGHLLEDLYCRLSALTIHLPPLSKRLADLPLLAERILERLRGAGDQRRLTLSQDGWNLLHNYSWPGNLRELHSVLLEARRRARTDGIELGDLPAFLRPTPARVERTLPLKTLLAQVERRLIELALAQARQNKSRAAELLAIWRPLLLRRMKALGIEETDE